MLPIRGLYEVAIPVRQLRKAEESHNPSWTRSGDQWPHRPRLDPGHVPLLRGPRRPRTGVVRALYV